MKQNKLLKLTLTALLFFNLLPNLLAATPVSVIVPPEEVFILSGFDDNDEVELFVSGFLPTVCHQQPQIKHRIFGNQIIMTVTALHYDQSNPFCTPVSVPYLEVIKLGTLKAQDYDIYVNMGTPHELTETLHIERSSEEDQNNYLYAQVAYIENAPNKKDIYLVGTNPSDCFELDQMKWVSNNKNALALLPILKVKEMECHPKATPFKYKVNVPPLVDASKILIHVRRMDGKSLNIIFEK